MRADLLHQVAELEDITNAILLTHNIDFVFLQSMAMSCLRRCGNPTLTIFADADCAATSYRAQRGLLDGIGTRYRVVPIRMAHGFVFHPKALLLTGPRQAVLFVGSGNLTFGGWRQNGEVWARYNAAEDGRTVFDEFRGYVQALLSRVPLPSAIQSELEDAFDPATKAWCETAPVGAQALLSRAGGEPALLGAVVAALGPAPVDELYVCSPYYDIKGDALVDLRASIKYRSGWLLYPGRGSTLTPAAWQRVEGAMIRSPCEIRHPHPIQERPAFIHAKFYAAIRGDEAVIVQGSANCSRAALLMDGPAGNAELMAVVRTSTSDFRARWLDVLQPSSPSELVDCSKNLEDEVSAPIALQVLAARAQDAVIVVAYHPPQAKISACSLDGVEIAFSLVEAGQLRALHIGAAVTLQVRGIVDGLEVTSEPHWVDQESQLRSTARRRRLEDAVPRTIGGERWTSDQWLELLHSLGEHLKYTPIRAQQSAAHRSSNGLVPAHRRRFEDIFAKEYSSNNMLAHWQDDLPPAEAHDSVRKLLLRWLGIGGDGEPGQATTSNSPPDDTTNKGEGDEPEELPSVTVSARLLTSTAMTERSCARLRQILAEIQTTVTSPSFLEARPPDFLQSDLKMISAILRFGVAKGWLAVDACFDFTHAVWAALFLSSAKDPQIGWIEWRWRKAPDPNAFMAALSSPQLSAALIGWMIIGVGARHSLSHSRFLLARAVSIARLPELWFGGAFEDIAHELRDLLRASRMPDEHWSLAQISELWREALLEGEALRHLEELLEILGLGEALGLIHREEVFAGDLLWQGPAGYCLAIEHRSRTAAATIQTTKLQRGGTGSFRGDMTMPVAAMIEAPEVRRALPHQDHDVLKRLLIILSNSN